MPERRGSAAARFSAADRLAFHAAVCLLRLLRLLPSFAAIRVAHGVGLALGLLMRRWRETAEDNLQKALPALPSAERRRIRRGACRVIGRIAFALAKLPTWSERQIREHVEFVGLERFRAGRSRGRGVLLLTAHLGNWELGALAHGRVEGPLHVLVRPIDNPLVDSLVQRLRCAHGNGVIAKRHSARRVLQVLRENGTVGILADQNAVREEAVFVDFFGIPAAANKGFAQLALRSGAAVVPAVAWWDGTAGRHIVEYGPEIEVTRTGDDARDIQVNTQRFQQAIEERVRRHPGQWLWMHGRWKTRPPAE